MNKKIENIAQKSLNGTPIDIDDARDIFSFKGDEIYDVLYWANKIRLKYFRTNINLCAILSAKQGSCSEDCKFCAQSTFYKTGTETLPLANENRVNESIKLAKQSGASSLGLVTSGYSLEGRLGSNGKENDFNKFCDLVESSSKSSPLPLHASIGCLTPEMAGRLSEIGVEQINHNLETSRNLFAKVCETHTYDERISTIKNAKKAGLKICSGGIFGIGENSDDIVELAFTLRDLDVDTIPLNFLNQVQGTPFYGNEPLKPMEILMIIALFRFTLPDKEIKVAGGRETCLRDLQSWMFYAGASSAMVGDYLTTKGKPANEDIQMIKDLGLNHSVKRENKLAMKS